MLGTNKPDKNNTKEDGKYNIIWRLWEYRWPK